MTFSNVVGRIKYHLIESIRHLTRTYLRTGRLQKTNVGAIVFRDRNSHRFYDKRCVMWQYVVRSTRATNRNPIDNLGSFRFPKHALVEYENYHFWLGQIWRTFKGGSGIIDIIRQVRTPSRWNAGLQISHTYLLSTNFVVHTDILWPNITLWRHDLVFIQYINFITSKRQISYRLSTITSHIWNSFDVYYLAGGLGKK